MLPPASLVPANFGSYWTDEQVILSLDKFMKGFPLPDDVIQDINPYQYNPANLPDGIWYFVRSTERKETASGHWRARGEACEIYKDSAISCWRTTLEYFEGSAPLGRRTEWLMQEYKITLNGLGEEKEMKGSRTLCRIFLCDGEGAKTDSGKTYRDVDTVGEKICCSVPTVPSTESTSTRDTRGEIPLKNMESPEADRLQDSVSENLDYILSGDYLELDDLVDQESRASSSDISSCLSSMSDEMFDLLVGNIEDDQKKDPTSKFSIATLARPDEVVMQPATTGSVAADVGGKSRAEKTESVSATKANIGKDRAEQRNKSTLSYHHEASSSKSHKTNRKGEEASGSSKKKIKNKYLCFMPF